MATSQNPMSDAEALGKAPARNNWLAYDPRTPKTIKGPLGTIGVKRPNAMLRGEIGRRKARLIQGLDVDAETWNRYHMIATLSVVTEEPGHGPNHQELDWDKVHDDWVIDHYYSRYQKWDLSFEPTEDERKQWDDDDDTKSSES